MGSYLEGAQVDEQASRRLWRVKSEHALILVHLGVVAGWLKASHGSAHEAQHGLIHACVMHGHAARAADPQIWG